MNLPWFTCKKLLVEDLCTPIISRTLARILGANPKKKNCFGYISCNLYICTLQKLVLLKRNQYLFFLNVICKIHLIFNGQVIFVLIRATK